MLTTQKKYFSFKKKNLGYIDKLFQWIWFSITCKRENTHSFNSIVAKN